MILKRNNLSYPSPRKGGSTHKPDSELCLKLFLPGVYPGKKCGAVICGLLFFLFLSSFAALAQDTATVFGKITNAENLPLGDISVSIFGSPQPPVYTDQNGEYSYTIPADQEVVIVFYSLTYKQEKRTVKLAPGERLELNRALTFKNLIKEVVVTDGNRFLQVTRLDPLHITHIPTASQDFNAILFTLPGVSSRNELSSSYSVRGGNFDENLVYVNGIEVYRPFLVRSGQQEGLSFVNPDLVSSVLFSAGGFEAKYGDKMSSVLDVQYRKPRKFAGTVSGSLLGTNLHLEGSAQNYRLTWLIGARYKTNQYLLNGLDTKGQYKPFFGDVQTFITYDLTPEWELDFLGNYATNKYQIVPENRETDFGIMEQGSGVPMDFGPYRRRDPIYPHIERKMVRIQDRRVSIPKT